ncbi:MAG: deacetylase [Pseudomonadota bacterium]
MRTTFNSAAHHGRAFLITIDTEGDDLWGQPKTITTRNAAFLPRFQNLCEEFGFKPTWLTNYEMAMDPSFVKFGRDLAHRNVAEIGMHLHAWNSPPLKPLTDDDYRHQPYLVEFTPEVMEEKINVMTALLRDRFECNIVSHRAGRWAFDSTYAKLLAKNGYLVDCSVTPHVSWAQVKGDPAGSGGTDYRRFPALPYMLDLDDISQAGSSPILELPVSVIRSRLHQWAPLAYELPVVRRWAWQHQPDKLWLYPNGSNLMHMLTVVEQALRTNKPYLELILHSSELMPGGGPHFRDEASIDGLYRDLRSLFTVIAGSFSGRTLTEFRHAWLDAQPTMTQAGSGSSWVNCP